MRNKNNKRPLIRKLDAVIKELVFLRDHETCVRCGHTRPYQLHPSHVISRANKKLRWDMNNLKTLCATCHMWWHANPTDSGIWFTQKFPERMAHIEAHRYEIGKYTANDLKEMLEGFEKLLRRY